MNFCLLVHIFIRIILHITQRITNNLNGRLPDWLLCCHTCQGWRPTSLHPSLNFFKFLVLRVKVCKTFIFYRSANDFQKELQTKKDRKGDPQAMLKKKFVNWWDEDSEVLAKSMCQTTKCINSILSKLVIFPACVKIMLWRIKCEHATHIIPKKQNII